MCASLRSPYAAPFVVTTVILLLLVMTAEVRSRGTAFAFAITYAIFSFPMPISDPWRAMAWSLTQVGLLYLLLLRVTLRRAQPEPEAARQG
jgi:hypothetical protein